MLAAVYTSSVHVPFSSDSDGKLNEVIRVNKYLVIHLKKKVCNYY